MNKWLLILSLLLLSYPALADVELNGTTAAKYSETAGSNTAASPNGWPSGTFPNQVEGINRVTLAALQRFWNRLNGGLTVGGTANAITLTPANTNFPTSYVIGEIYGFQAAHTNTSATTININSIGIANLFKKTASGVTALTGGEITSGDMVLVSYDGTQFELLTTPDNVNSLSPISNNTVLGNVSGGSATPSALTATQLTTLINTFTSSLSGAVPASGGGTTNFLRADGTFAAPASGGFTSCTTVQTNSSATSTCGSGYYLTGGGCQGTGSITASYPSTPGLAGTWTCNMSVGISATFAMCCH